VCKKVKVFKKNHFWKGRGWKKNPEIEKGKLVINEKSHRSDRKKGGG